MTEQQPLVLLVDDEEDLCLLMQMSLARIGIKTHLAYRIEQAKQFFTEFKYDACLTDLSLPDGHGLDLVKHVTHLYPDTPIAVITAHGSMDTAIEALKLGAFDFVNKPVNQVHLELLVQKALNRPKPEQEAAEIALENKLLIGRSPSIQKLRTTLKKIARTQAPVYITGESGTGKEVVANLIHRLSNRSDGPFITINCGAIPHELMESEFFGHQKGSFIGASQDKQGLVQSAHGGSLFLDEIAELPLNMQVKLLRAIQEKKIRPIGTHQDINVDFRVISASHHDLESMVEQGRFRQDLYFLIHVMNLDLPPLRDRGQDIIVLANHFIQKICREWELPAKQLSPEVQSFLLAQYYPGNVRELRNMMERAITLSDDYFIHVEHIQSAPLRRPPSAQVPSIQNPNGQSIVVPQETHISSKSKKLPAEGLEAYLENIEKEVLLNALDLTHWNRTLAAKKLGMTFRSLRYRLKKFGLDTDEEI